MIRASLGRWRGGLECHGAGAGLVMSLENPKPRVSQGSLTSEG